MDNALIVQFGHSTDYTKTIMPLIANLALKSILNAHYATRKESVYNVNKLTIYPTITVFLAIMFLLFASAVEMVIAVHFVKTAIF
jgi:hypothetical protein